MGSTFASALTSSSVALSADGSTMDLPARCGVRSERDRLAFSEIHSRLRERGMYRLDKRERKWVNAVLAEARFLEMRDAEEYLDMNAQHANRNNSVSLFRRY